MLSSDSDFLLRFKERLKQLDLGQGKNVLIAWSGGMDSTLLVYLMKHHTSSHVYTAYYNHRLRSNHEIQKEMELLHGLSCQWGVPLFTGSAEEGEIEALRRRHHGSLEEWARVERYRFLENIKQEHHIAHLMTAHHQDDEAETLIMRFLQGASVMGLSGMEGKQPFQSPLMRPFLSFSRRELRTVAEELGLSWSEDSSNGQKNFLRNRIRKELLPVVESIFPAYKESLQIGAEKNAFYVRGIQQQLQKLSIEENRGILSLSLTDFKKSPSYLRLEVLYYMADRLLKGSQHGKRIPYRFFRDLLDDTWLTFRREGHGLILRSWKGKLQMLRKPLNSPFQEPLILPLNEWIDCGEWKIKISRNRISPQAIHLQGEPGEWSLRNRREGDRMDKPGKLKKRLSAFPREERPFIPLLVKGKEVQCLVYGRKEKIFKDLKSSNADSSSRFYLILEHNDAE